MAKVKKPKKNNRHKAGVMGRSDIPYAQRIAMQQNRDIVNCRNHAAQITMFCMSIAMYEVEGIGYKRLVRFSLHFKDIVDEFYEDPEVGMAHAKRRMEQIGMPISGEFFSVKQEGATVREQQVHDHALQAAQIAQFCGAIAMNDEFGFGQERQQKISEKANELSARYAKEGKGFLLEKMAEIGFLIVDGEARAFIGDDGKAVTPTQARKEGYPNA